MRSLVGPARAEEAAAPRATSPQTAAASAPESLRPPGAAQPLQAKLYETTERLALALVERAEKDLAQPAADGKGPSVRDLQQTVEFAMGLLVKLPKLKPEDDSEDAGVDVLRAAMMDPAKIVDRLQANPKFIAALRAKGWLQPPDRPHHRPTKEQAAHREEYEARRAEIVDEEADEDGDSVLKNMLAGRAGIAGALPQ